MLGATSTSLLYCRVSPIPSIFSVKIVDRSIERWVEPFVVTGPIPLSISAESVFSDDQISVMRPPPLGRLSGIAANDPVGSSVFEMSAVVNLHVCDHWLEPAALAALTRQ